MTSVSVVRSIIQSADLKQTENVLEIGGGLGIVSEQIVANVNHLYVIEIEDGLVQALAERLQGHKNVTLIHGDALKVDIPKVDKIISNLPYSVASEITFRLLHEAQFKLAILMYQKEFAQRLLSKPGDPDYSRLSIDFQYLGNAEHIMEMKSKEFIPRPKVDSSVLRVTKRKEGPFAVDDSIFFWMVHGLYSYPNKQLRKALKIWLKLLGMPESLSIVIERVQDKVEITSRLRALTLDELVTIADTLLELIIEGKIPDPRGAADE